MVDLEGKSGVFPKVEKNGWTGIAFVNTENQQATVTLKAYTNTGTCGGDGEQNPGAHAKWVGLPIQSLFPGDNPSMHATYLSYTADRNVAGFQLNNLQQHMLDALPAASSQRPKDRRQGPGFPAISVHGHLRDDGR